MKHIILKNVFLFVENKVIIQVKIINYNRIMPETKSGF